MAIKRISRTKVFVMAAALAISGALAAYRLIAQDNVVPVEVPSILNKFDDDVPVETILNEYVQPNGGYETTGRSITFRFPRSFYTYLENAQGGPQRSIGISVDRTTLNRVGTQEDAADGDNSRATNAKILATRGPQNLGVQVYTNAGHVLEDSQHTIQEALRAGQISPLTAFCGMTWYLEREAWRYSSEPANKVVSIVPNETFGIGAALIAVLDGAEGVKGPAIASCPADGHSCEVYSSFSGWGVSFRLPRVELCAWSSELDRVKSFLGAHVVREIQQQP